MFYISTTAVVKHLTLQCKYSYEPSIKYSSTLIVTFLCFSDGYCLYVSVYFRKTILSHDPLSVSPVCLTSRHDKLSVLSYAFL